MPSKTIINTANISTSSTESETGNNGSSAGINVNRIDNTPIDNDPDPDKPHPNNPIAKTIVGKGVSYSASGVSFSPKCSGTCGGFAKLTTLRKLKVKGKKYGREPFSPGASTTSARPAPEGQVDPDPQGPQDP